MLLGGTVAASAQIQTNAGVQYLQCMQKDVSTDFSDLSNTYFLADSLVSFDAAKGEGLVQWRRYRMSPRQAFNLNGYWPVRMQMLDFLTLLTTTILISGFPSSLSRQGRPASGCSRRPSCLRRGMKMT